MEAQTNHEKSRLDAIERKDAAAAVKKTRLELGAFDYRVKEQAEQLTRCLLELDDVLSHGDVDVRSARKALVLFVQQLLPQADAFKERSTKLKQFGKAVLAGFADQAPSTPSDSGSESDDMHVKSLFQESDEEEEASASEAEVEGEVEQEDEDEEMVKAADVEEDESMEPEAEVDEEADDEAEDDDEEEEREIAPPHKSPRIQPSGDRQSLEIDVSSLPEWRPYYQLQRRQDGIYLIAHLNRIDPRNVRVQWNEHNGVLRVNGFRLPTQKDILMSRLSGAPTFGRFEIVEQFPRHMLDMEEATQQIFEDGTLQIRMPFHVVRRPLRYRPASLFQPQDCFVW
ncbi:BAG domain [Phytophthora cinnamomi]|uniref:BAG domain n=1 Tax=Phytophthora cinnamomi TaxID=4785 RepID=UPI003559F7FE|nr:BAG domain [Phytophthora cinnamomi]